MFDIFLWNVIFIDVELYLIIFKFIDLNTNDGLKTQLWPFIQFHWLNINIVLTVFDQNQQYHNVIKNKLKLDFGEKIQIKICEIT